MNGVASLVPLSQQARFGPTPEWEAEAKAIQRNLRDRAAILGTGGEVVDHAAAEGEGE